MSDIAAIAPTIAFDPRTYRRALIEARRDWSGFAALCGWTPTIRHHRKRRVRTRRLARRRHHPARCWRCNPRGNPPSTAIRNRKAR